LSGWSNGDFNYDGKVNIDDYTQFIDANIGTQGAAFLTSNGDAALAGPLTAVPEPGAVGTALAILVAGMRYKRQRAVQER
jgi:hypothetical protein